jgi:MraZ protein
MAGGSNIYVGEHARSIDAKARVALPAKWRFGTKNEECVYLALPNPAGCVTVYPPSMVEKLSEKIAEVSLGDDVGQRTLTRLFSRADQLICDSQGRIQINKLLLAHADLEKDVIVVGNFVTFSIWKPERYGKYIGEESCEGDEINKILTKLGL